MEWELQGRGESSTGHVESKPTTTEVVHNRAASRESWTCTAAQKHKGREVERQRSTHSKIHSNTGVNSD